MDDQVCGYPRLSPRRIVHLEADQISKNVNTVVGVGSCDVLVEGAECRRCEG